MARRWLPRVAVVSAVAETFLAGVSAAQAGATININDGNVPTTAADFTHECSANQGGGPYPDLDVWVFVLPGNHATSGDFVSVTANFDTNGDNTPDTTKVINTDGGGFVNGGPAASKAYIATTAGWTLISASAVITGTAEFFNLTHTCAAGTSTRLTPTTSPSTSTSTPTTATSTSTTATSTSSTATSTSTTVTASSATPTAGSGGSQLPITGTAIGGIAVAGVAMIAAGAALVFARRRRHQTTQTPGD